MKKFAIILAVMFSCADEQGATQALQNMGMTQIELKGWDAFACGDDNTCTGFEATNPQGMRVKGAVGCGIGCKGCTVRFK